MRKKLILLTIWAALLIPTTIYAAYSTDQSSFPFETPWIEADCLPHNQIAQITADSASICRDFVAVEDSNGVIDGTPDSGNQGSAYLRIRSGATGTTNTASDGMAVTFPNAFLMSATNTPAIDAVARIGQVQNASSSLTIIGFATTTGVSPDYAVQPGGCMFVASSTQSNWQAVCTSGTLSGSLYSQVDTGIASSSVVTGNGSYFKFHIDVNGSSASFYIQATSTGLTNVATITGMSVPSTTPMVPIAAVAKTAAGLTQELHLRNMRVLYIEKLW